MTSIAERTPPSRPAGRAPRRKRGSRGAPPRSGAAKVVARASLAALGRRLRAQGCRIAFANGCFDLLHPGHVTLLETARRKADVLVVGLNSDRSVSRLKGPGRPLLAQRDRARMLAALECVDYVTVFGEATPLKIIRLLAPHIIVKGSDWKKEDIVGREEVESWGGRVVRVRLQGSYSTSAILKSLRGG